MPIYQPSDPEISAKKGIHVYYYWLSNCAARVCMALEEKGVEWTPHAVSLLMHENLTDEYFRINPKGLVPAMIHDGVVITESIDILRYIEEQFPQPALYPTDPEARKKVEEWMDTATEAHVGVIKTYMYSLALGGTKKKKHMEEYAKKQPDQELINFHQQTFKGFSQDRILQAERDVFVFFDKLEAELSQHRWLVGDEFSYADITWFVQYFMMKRVGLVNFAKYPNITRWAADLMSRPCFRNGVAALQPWYAPLLCTVLRTKTWVKRGFRLPLKGPRLSLQEAGHAG